jgi:hypothetical protein
LSIAEAQLNGDGGPEGAEDGQNDSGLDIEGWDGLLIEEDLVYVDLN